MRRIKNVLTFSNVIALVALFVALGGSVYAAGRINGKQIKTKSLPGNRLKANSVPGNRLKAKTINPGKVKPDSLTSTQIDESKLTGVTAASIGSVQYAVSAVPVPPSGATAFAGCPAGLYVIGGGATLNNDEGFVTSSGPVATRVGWIATGFGFAAGTTMTVTAICTNVKTPLG